MTSISNSLEENKCLDREEKHAKYSLMLDLVPGNIYISDTVEKCYLLSLRIPLPLGRGSDNLSTAQR